MIADLLLDFPKNIHLGHILGLFVSKLGYSSSIIYWYSQGEKNE